MQDWLTNVLVGPGPMGFLGRGNFSAIIGVVPGKGNRLVTLVEGPAALLHDPHVLQTQRRCSVSVVHLGRPVSRENLAHW